jgi:hypothetical protein
VADPQREGFVELEQNFARLLRNKGGTGKLGLAKIVNRMCRRAFLQALPKSYPIL